MNDTNPNPTVGFPVASSNTAFNMPPLPTPNATTELQFPAPKKKNKLMPVLALIGGFFLLIGAAGASYFVSTRVSSRQAIAPNAPSSKPMAANCIDGDANSMDDCWACCRCDCGAEFCANPAGPGGCSQQCDAACGGGGGGGGGACVRGAEGPEKCSVPSVGGANNCTQSGFTFGCGTECCNTSFGSVCCCTGCYPEGTDCSQHTCTPQESCEVSKRDTPSANTIKFNKTGKIILFTRNFVGTVTLTGPRTQVWTTTAGVAVQNTNQFDVVAGETYTIAVKWSVESANGYGWRPNKAPTTCGPTNAICGEDADITPVKNLAIANSDLVDIVVSNTTNPATIQCWADKIIPDDTQDYDFNDGTIILGYKKVAEACTETKLFVPLIQSNFPCTTNAECTIADQPEGQYCATAVGKCATWQPIPLADLPKRARIGDPIKMSFAALVTNQVQVKVNTGAWENATKNATTGKFDYIYTIPAGGAYDVKVQYLIP